MTGALADSIGPALGTWPEPLERRYLVGVDLLDEEIVSDELAKGGEIVIPGFGSFKPTPSLPACSSS